ncbi:MAG: flagellar basal-body rod protein FlgF [Alphaproteobacteria bacterium CG_4_9_14_3_um_filter_47_13]|nr:MAG: flagellar basal-body rod protein FlgF [Alphaproteobacteria bacterium CG_4_9_14_3_um_filter_47_13]
MENPIYIGLSRQVALRAQMDVIANNVANMSTPGYRSQNMVFTEFLEKPKGKNDTIGKQDPLSFVLDYGHYQTNEPGSMQYTGNQLDVALNGPGYIGIQPQGSTETAYTRAGNFQVNVKGELVTGRGDPVMGEGGGAIIIPEDSGKIKIAEDGSIANANGQIGKLKISEFDDLQALEARGDGLYYTTQEGKPAEKTRAIQGMVEGSNVKPVLEMTRMIDVLRSYQSTQRLLQSEHERQRTMIQRLSRGS